MLVPCAGETEYPVVDELGNTLPTTTYSWKCAHMYSVQSCMISASMRTSCIMLYDHIAVQVCVGHVYVNV